ncbi:C2 domain-containing protein [Zopfochytrium polystomum]|nr:C2 domain-containing protein [Zopfochytrium polystomum]
MGVVEVQVVKAKDLNRKDLVTNNDAFVELYTNDRNYKQRTKTVQSATPEWHQTFTLNYEHEHVVHFHVLDKDVVGSDGIGYAKFDFKHLAHGRPEATELTLYANPLDFTPNGYLTIIVTVKS